tara:strand:- start:3176 stop:4858 length:1683 start_codon:yes stop_codon:yes gene_type:complete
MTNYKEKLIIKDYKNEFYFKKNISNLNFSFNRSAFIFFVFVLISSIFSIKIFYYGSILDNQKKKNVSIKQKDFRADILDRNGILIAKTVRTKNVGINPNKVKDKKKFLLKLKIIFPKKNFKNIEEKLNQNKFFYLEKKISAENFDKIKLLGEKAFIYETKISRIYPSKNLFSHIIGQIDEDNNGISGIEKSFNKNLISNKNSLILTVDSNLQFIIREELLLANQIFKTKGSAAILMDVNSGEIISMVSTPDYDLNKRQVINDKRFINRVTKGVYEFGSVFKTFTLASALNTKKVEVGTEFKNLPSDINCAGRPIREYDEKIPSNLTAEEILIRSGNIGSVRIAQKVGEEKFQLFLEKLGVLDRIDFELEEVGTPLPIKWGKCKLATASFGHGITTTILQLAKGYSIISNGGYNVNPTLIKDKYSNLTKEKILNKNISNKLNLALRKIVSTNIGTANLANVKGYDVGGKTGTAQKSIDGTYSKEKINTFIGVFPIYKPKFVIAVMLDAPKINSDYIYEYRDGTGFKLKGTPRNTAGWTSVEITGKILEKIGPILATKYMEF